MTKPIMVINYTHNDNDNTHDNGTNNYTTHNDNATNSD